MMLKYNISVNNISKINNFKYFTNNIKKGDIHDYTNNSNDSRFYSIN